MFIPPPHAHPAPDPVRDWAESGVVPLTVRADGPPIVPPGQAATVTRAMASWISDVSALGGRRIDVDGAGLLSERAALTGFRRRGDVSLGGSCRLLPTADGWVAVSCARPDDPALLGAMASDLVDEDDPWPVVADWVRRHRGTELAERGTLVSVAAGPVVRARTSPLPPMPLHPRPVDGLLVVDFSALWAGPLCAHLLGLAGARVVKVETPDRPDGARRGNASFYRLLRATNRWCSIPPRSAVSRYRSGETNELRADASKKLRNVKAEDIMARAGVLRPDGTPKTAVIRVKGGVMVRNGADEGYDYRVCTLDFANSDTPFTSEESRELAAALANDDHARVVALLERHATLDYPENKGFDRYSDQFGFHFDHIDSVHIDWI